MVELDDIKIGNGKNLVFIVGPCVIENEKMLFETCESIKNTCSELKIPFIFKTSYDKANRTSINSYRGPGLEEGLKILKNLKKEMKVKLLVDVHCKYDVEKVAEVADIIQIPAFLCRQTDLLLEVGKTGKVVNIKKGQFISPYAVKYIFEKVESTGNRKILLTERGTSFGYGRLIVDFASVPIMKKFGYPLIFDATHSVQIPSVGESFTEGEREAVPVLVNAAVAAGFDGIFMEVHPNPDEALSDSKTMISTKKLKSILKNAIKIFEILKDNRL